MTEWGFRPVRVPPAAQTKKFRYSGAFLFVLLVHDLKMLVNVFLFLPNIK